MEDSLIDKINQCTAAQRVRIEALVDAFLQGASLTTNPDSDFATPEWAAEFADVLHFHHLGTDQPLSKDKFEYAMVTSFRNVGVPADKTPGGTHPGQDITVNGVPWSLKTEAARGIRRDHLHISKFKELGRGPWQTQEDLIALRQSMFDHLDRYDRIFSLRCFRITPGVAAQRGFDYELIEIPKALLQSSARFPITFKTGSTQNPVPASCYVHGEEGNVILELYFDGGSERKLQIRQLLKSECVVHATWTLHLP